MQETIDSVKFHLKMSIVPLGKKGNNYTSRDYNLNTQARLSIFLSSFFPHPLPTVSREGMMTMVWTLNIKELTLKNNVC